jgi:Fe-S cluster assembly iron-binding protein IscA
MITVTETAVKELTNYFKDKEASPIRVHLVDGGCAGPQLSLALDNQCDGDKSVTQGDLTFLISEDLAEATGAVTIDMTPYGFTVASENPMGGGGSCGCSSCGTGGCSC